MMFRPIRSVEYLACFRNRDVDNLLLDMQCSAQNGAKSVAFSMAMMVTAFCAYIYSQSLKQTSVLHFKLRRVREDYRIVDNCIVNDTLCGIALTQVSLPHCKGEPRNQTKG